MIELKVSEELNRRLKGLYDKNLKEYKALSTIIRLPAMTKEFWKILRSKESEKEQTAHQKQAIRQMVDIQVQDESS